MTDATDAQLAAQYEALPYPARDPRDEAKRLVVGSPSHLAEVDHWVFGARRAAELPLRALVAGGGTGDGAIMLAQQMAWAGRPGEVVWLDRSGAARKVAEARAAARGLENIRFVEGSILDLPDLGRFDYVDCCGVLHHLPDPLAGLRNLSSVLAPGGGMGIMVYAPHGRTGVYMLQDALRMIAPPGEAPAARVDLAKRVMRHLPETAWLRKNPWISDHLPLPQGGGDSGLYDLLLNPRDVAFTVPQLDALVRDAGMRISCLVEPVRYDPDFLLPDPKLRARTAGMGLVERAALAEALAGNMGIHIAYLARAEEPELRADWGDASAVPLLRGGDGASWARGIRGGSLPITYDGLRINLPVPPLSAAILARIDGKRSLGEVARAVEEGGAAPAAVARDMAALCAAMEKVNRLLLTAPRGP
ncbi:class I SAM-dependent methyltransferase [Roseomonas sp. SSH11]|uniref:Class I SAM-dependent methyltransferase n=1 Tax=Pararoseomonas baculiformis TaxID=2820812 RepID=A0ABS4ACA0_9PROT|nr:class I SAM-dependent methyltransferase [Pararoseomonas baculiformis]MBP0444636.1 class I SAM-dependent methyltransferase [Pararoseomonas baculiformis]